MMPPVALTIAGSDSSAGAGIQADLKSFSALGVYGLTAVTCVVAEVPGKVAGLHPVSPELVGEQIGLAFQAFPVRAVKTGMLYSRAIMERVCEKLAGTGVPLVVDPVMMATSGDSLVQPEAIRWCRKHLLPMATLVTPNLDEAGLLLGRAVATLEEMRRAVAELALQLGTSVLLKGGHLQGTEAIDLLAHGQQIREFRAPYLAGRSTHGTGCTYSAAITAGLARGWPLDQAVARAKQYVWHAIRDAFQWEFPAGNTEALNHFAQQAPEV